MFRLTLNLNGRPVQRYNFDQEVVCIGRDPQCEVLIDNIGISRRHATIETAEGEYVLTDLKSHNGTYVQGRRVYHHKLMENDEFFIGKYSLCFENLDLGSEEPAEIQEKRKSAAMQDMTFRLDRDEIERLMGQSTTANVPRLAQLTPQTEQRTVLLERPYYLVGKSSKAGIRIQGLFVPHYAALFVRNDKWFHVVSLSKRSPVRVNGLAVTDHQLSDGDVVQVGSRKFRFARG